MASCPRFQLQNTASSAYDCPVEEGLGRTLRARGYRPVKIAEYHATSRSLASLGVEKLAVLPCGLCNDFTVDDYNDRGCTCGTCSDGPLAPRYYVECHENGAAYPTDGEHVIWVRTKEWLAASDGRYAVYYHPTKATVVFSKDGGEIARMENKHFTSCDLELFLAGYDAAHGQKEEE